MGDVRIYHPESGGEATVAESAVPILAGAGWQKVDDQAAQQAVDDGLDGMTVEQLRVELRSRDLPVTGNKAELVDRLRGEPEPAAEEEAEPEQEEPGEAAEQTQRGE
jgi:hypothetical protein